MIIVCFAVKNEVRVEINKVYKQIIDLTYLTLNINCIISHFFLKGVLQIVEPSQIFQGDLFLHRNFFFLCKMLFIPFITNTMIIGT